MERVRRGGVKSNGVFSSKERAESENKVENRLLGRFTQEEWTKSLEIGDLEG